jgi:hypothetical protein
VVRRGLPVETLYDGTAIAGIPHDLIEVDIVVFFFHA